MTPQFFLIAIGVTNRGRFFKFKYKPPVSYESKISIVDEKYSTNLKL